jgi:RND family efflux transporter MFP subunit
MNKLYSILCFTASAAVYLTGCSSKTETAKTDKIIPVKTLTVSASASTDEHNYVGVAEESSALSLSFSLAGTVERIMVTEGQRVSKGQLLAALNSGTAQNAYDISQSTLKQAQDAYNRLSELHKKGSITDIQFVEVETGLEKAVAMEAISRKSLEDTKLYTPIAGIVATRSIEKGANVAPGISAFKVVSIDEIDIKVSIPENEISRRNLGQSATITVPAINDMEYTGRVDKKGVEANALSHTYDIKIRVKNQQAKLMPGMVCKVSLSEGGLQPQFVIPNKSVQIAPDDKHFVWLADGTTAKRCFITIGKLTDYGITVKDGLSEGDQVIIDGFNKVSEGMQISVIQ